MIFRISLLLFYPPPLISVLSLIYLPKEPLLFIFPHRNTYIMDYFPEHVKIVLQIGTALYAESKKKLVITCYMDFDYSVHSEAILANLHTRMVLPSKTLLFLHRTFFQLSLLPQNFTGKKTYSWYPKNSSMLFMKEIDNSHMSNGYLLIYQANCALHVQQLLFCRQKSCLRNKRVLRVSFLCTTTFPSPTAQTEQEIYQLHDEKTDNPDAHQKQKFQLLVSDHGIITQRFVRQDVTLVDGDILSQLASKCHPILSMHWLLMPILPFEES